MLRSPDQTNSRGFPYLVGSRESHLDLHHLLWSLLSWIAVMTVYNMRGQKGRRAGSWNRTGATGVTGGFGIVLPAMQT